MSLDVFRSILSLAQEAGELIYMDAVLLPLLALPPVAALIFSLIGLFLPQVRAAFRSALRPVRLFCGGILLLLFLLTGASASAYGVAVFSWLLSHALAAPLFVPPRSAGAERADGRRAKRRVRAEKRDRSAGRKKEPVLPRAAAVSAPAMTAAPTAAEQDFVAAPSAGGAKPPFPAPSGNAPAAYVRSISSARGASPYPDVPRAQNASAYGQGAQTAGAPMPPLVRCYEEEKPVVVEKDVRLGHIFSTLERLRDLPLSAGDRLEAQKTEELLTVYRAKGTLTPPEADTLNDILAALLKMMAKYQM